MSGLQAVSRYVTYYGAQSLILSFATGVVAYQYGRPELWILALLTLAIKGIGIPIIARRMLIVRLELKGTPRCPPGCRPRSSSVAF